MSDEPDEYRFTPTPKKNDGMPEMHGENVVSETHRLMRGEGFGTESYGATCGSFVDLL